MLNPLRRPFSRRSAGGATKSTGLRTEARLALYLPTRLLLSVAPAGEKESRRIVASTINVSETGMAVALPEAEAAGQGLCAGQRLDVQLDVFPAGVVGMSCEVVWRDRFESREQTGHVLGLKVVEMSHRDNARFLEYLGTRGYERAVGEKMS